MLKHYPRVGLGVLIFNDQNQIILGKRLSSHGAHSWGPPGGHLEFGENFECCAIREVREETGLEIKNPRLMGITNDVFEAEAKHYVSIFMRAQYPIGQQLVNKEPNKIDAWQWFGIDDLPENLFLPLAQFKKQGFFNSIT